MAEGTRKPWWAAALAGGFGAVLGVAYLLAQPAQGHEPRIATAGVSVLPAGTLSLDERLNRIETQLTQVKDELVEIRGRLPAKK